MLSREQQMRDDEAFARQLQTSESDKALALYSFSDGEINKIKSRFATLDGLQQAVVSTSLEDQAITFEWIKNPVFIKGDGEILDSATVMDMCQRQIASPRSCKTFTEAEIIPCNALIAAMLTWLNIIDAAPNKPIDTPVNAESSEKEILEKLYKHLPPAAQQLFNLLCRDKNTNIIFANPVLLPDGYVYEKTTVERMLTHANGKTIYCPNSRIPFTLNDVTSCYFIKNILDKLREMATAQAENLARNARAATAAVASAASAKVGDHNMFRQVSSKSAAVDEQKQAPPQTIIIYGQDAEKRTSMIAKINILMISLGFLPRPARHNFLMNGSMWFFGLLASSFQEDPYKIPLHAPGSANNDMFEVLKTAIVSLELLDLPILTNAKNHCKKFADVSTTAGSLFGKKSSLETSGYAKFASTLGTVKYQPGWYVHQIVHEVEKLIPELTKQRRFDI